MCGFWETFQTDWICLDAELMPWSFKGGKLLVRQYAPVGAAAEVGLRAARQLVAQTERPELEGFGQTLTARAGAVAAYRMPIASTAGWLPADSTCRLRLFNCWRPRVVPILIGLIDGTWSKPPDGRCTTRKGLVIPQ